MLCVKCKKDLPFDSFGVSRQRLCGRKSQCKTCVNDYQKQYNLNHKKQVRQISKKYYDSHKDDLQRKRKNAAPQAREYWKRYSENPDVKEKRREKAKKYYQQNKEKILQTRLLNAACIREKAKEYRRQNKEVLKERKIKWAKSENGKLSQQVRSAKRRTRLRENGGSFTRKEWISLKEKYDFKCLKCGVRESTTNRLQPDHVIPVVKGGPSWISNIQPLCRKCNIEKDTDTTDYRLLKQYDR